MKNYGEFYKSGKIILGAHRGDLINHPENTMPAFISSFNMGVDAIETDVRCTKDGHLVLIHDRSVERTTNGVGFIDQMTLKEVKNLDAGSYKGNDFKGYQIPTVDEFLEWVKDTDLVINWELKEYPVELGDRAYKTADMLIEKIEKYGLCERSLMNSFSQQLLEYIYDKYNGKYIIHAYVGYEKWDTSKKPIETFADWSAIWRKDEDHICGFKQDYDYVNSFGVLPCILIPDTVENYKKAIELGCPMFTTNDIKTATECLKALGKR